jgi:hypothetical protein
MSRPLVGYLLAAFAIAALVLAWGERFAPLNQTTFGILLQPHGADAVVSRVNPESDAARFGIRSGDVALISKISLSDRYRLMTGSSPAGTPVTVPVAHGTSMRVVTIDAMHGRTLRGGAAGVNGTMFLFSVTVTLLIVAFVALRQPSLATAALVLYGAGTLTTYNAISQFSWLPNPIYGAIGVCINALFGQLPALALLPFIVRFPRTPESGAARTRMHIADAIFICGAIGAVIQAVYEPLTFASWGTFDVSSSVFYAAIAPAFAIIAYTEASGEERRRIAWVLAGFVVSAVAYAGFNIGDSNLVTANDWWAPGLTLVSQGLQTALPLALAYAVLRHRVLDIGFVLNRTAVYAVMTTLVVAVVGLIDWLATRLLSEQRLALAIEAVVTISFGFALNWIHGRMESLLDRAVFRQRYIAEKCIDYRIGALGFAASTGAVDEALGTDAAQILDLSSAAVFGRLSPTAPFRRRVSTGWSTENVASVDPDSLLARTLRSLERPLFLDDVALVPSGFPEGVLRPILAIPITAQHELIGFALYGNHTDGASPDPEEVSLLARLTASAANAYGAVEARQWRERANALEESIRSLTTAPSTG